MSETTKPYNEIDDYIAAFSDEEHQEYAAAETALDLATMPYRISLEQEPTQQQALERLPENHGVVVRRADHGGVAAGRDLAAGHGPEDGRRGPSTPAVRTGVEVLKRRVVEHDPALIHVVPAAHEHRRNPVPHHAREVVARHRRPTIRRECGEVAANQDFTVRLHGD